MQKQESKLEKIKERERAHKQRAKEAKLKQKLKMEEQRKKAAEKRQSGFSRKAEQELRRLDTLRSGQRD